MSLKNNPISKSSKIKLALTIGDPSGIGPAIVARAVTQLNGFAEFTIIADKWVFSQVSGLRHQGSGIKFIDLKNINRKKFSFGKTSAEYGLASIEYLDKAMELLRAKTVDCLVTAPISKEAINLAGFRYSGHTEYLMQHTKVKNTVMMLLNKDLKISLVTRHIPLKDVPRTLNSQNLSQTISITHQALIEYFKIKDPKIVVCGLNPHASDNGLIGKEENSIIKPLIKRSRFCLDGPLSADVAIHKAKTGVYDAVIAMYHDQALIPLKLSGNESGVNLTLGLPFIRTSPLHGTAHDIASNFYKAQPDSLIAAIKTAVVCTLNQKRD